MSNYDSISRTDRHYLTLMNHTRADLNAALDYVCSAFAHNPERAISESNLATVAAIDAINHALKALNAPRPVLKYKVVRIVTPQFAAYKDENGYTIRYRLIPYKHNRHSRGIYETHETMQKLEWLYDRNGIK